MSCFQSQYFLVLVCDRMDVVLVLPGLKSFSLTSLELQMLTNSCVKLQTVHSIPLTINKEGEDSMHTYIQYIKVPRGSIQYIKVPRGSIQYIKVPG